MSSLSYVTSAQITDAVQEIDGKTLGRPALLVSDGLSTTYGVDVDIGQKMIDPNTADELVVPLRNVPLAAGNNEVIYADAGAAVRLRKSSSGRWEVVGFSKRAPGSYTRVPVTIDVPGDGPIHYSIGTPFGVGWSVRKLTFEELGTLADFGTLPWGAIGRFRGGELVEVVS